jgi:hypothetical protein
MEPLPPDSGTKNLELLRVFILGVLALGLVGTVIELVLLGHYEEPLQFVPLVLIAAAIAALVWQVIRPSAASLLTLQIVMLMHVLAGFVGIVAHFYGSAEYQLELNPQMPMSELIDKVLRAKAPPLLAPGMMIQLGLLGLAYVYSDLRYRARVLRWLGAMGYKPRS